MLNLLEAVVAGLVTVDVGLVVVRVAVAEEEVVGREVEVVVAGLVKGRTVEAVLGRVVDVLFSAVVEPAMLERRSSVDVVGLTGALVAEVPTSDMRLAAVLEMPRFSSPELATDRWDFSSAELLTEARDRWPAVVVVVVLRGLRTVVVVAGRVGGLFRVLPLVAAGRVVEVVVLEGPDMEVGRFVVVVPDKGRRVLVVEEGLFLTGEALTFSLSLETSGLVTGSSLPERMVESTGVAGGAISGSTSAGATGVTGSSVDAMLWRRSSSEIGVQEGGRFAAFSVVKT